MKLNFRLSPTSATTLFVLLVILFIPWLGETLFNSKGEPREAIVAMTMIDQGNWILPVNYGGDIPYKPPFLAWLIAIFAYIFNGGVVNEFISRLPSALAVIAMTMAGYHWARRQRSETFAMVMALVTVTSAEVFRAAIACRLDMVLTAAIVIALYLFYDLLDLRCRHRGRKYFYIIVLLTCAVLTKGPVGSLLPCFVAGVFYLLRGERFLPTLGRMLLIAVAAMAIPAVWYYAASLQGGQTFLDLAYEENIGRLTGTMTYESHENPWWYNFMTLTVGMLPWTLLALLSLLARKHLPRLRFKPAGLFMATTFAVVVLFYCIPASKRSVYLLPVYPAMAYGIAHIISLISRTRVMKGYAWLMAVIAFIAPIGVIVANCVDLGLAVAPVPFWCWIFALPPLVIAVGWFINRSDSVFFTLGSTFALFLFYVVTVQPMVLEAQSDHKLLDRIEQAAPEGPVYSLRTDRLTRYYTLNFYLGDRMRVIDSFDDFGRLGQGAVMLFPEWADTTGIGDRFDIDLLTRRSCDNRRKIFIAVNRAAGNDSVPADTINAVTPLQ